MATLDERTRKKIRRVPVQCGCLPRRALAMPRFARLRPTPKLFRRRFNLGQDGACSFDDGLRRVVWDHVIAIRHKNLVAMRKSMSEFALELNHHSLFFNVWSSSRCEDDKWHISKATRSLYKGDTLEPCTAFVYFGGDGSGASLKRRENGPLLLGESRRMRARRRTYKEEDAALPHTCNNK